MPRGTIPVLTTAGYPPAERSGKTCQCLDFVILVINLLQGKVDHVYAVRHQGIGHKYSSSTGNGYTYQISTPPTAVYTYLYHIIMVCVRSLDGGALRMVADRVRMLPSHEWRPNLGHDPMMLTHVCLVDETRRQKLRSVYASVATPVAVHELTSESSLILGK